MSTLSCARQERTAFPDRAGRNLFSILDGDLPNHRTLLGKVRVIINISKELVERLGILRLDKLFHLI